MKPKLNPSLKGKSSIYEVHQFSSKVLNSSPEVEYRSEKSILAVREYKHFQQKHLKVFNQSHRVCAQGVK